VAFKYLLIADGEVRLTGVRPEPMRALARDPGFIVAVIQRVGTSRVLGHRKDKSEAVELWETGLRRNPGARVVLGEPVGAFRSHPVYRVLRSGR